MPRKGPAARAQFRLREKPQLQEWSFGTLYDYSIIGGNDALALFSDCDAALKYIAQQLQARADAIAGWLRGAAARREPRAMYAR